MTAILDEPLPQLSTSVLPFLPRTALPESLSLLGPSGPGNVDAAEIDGVGDHDGANDDSIGDGADPDPFPRLQPGQIRKKKHSQILKSWLNSNAEDLIAARSRGAANANNDDVLSLKQLMAQQESKPIIGSPREYQLQLFERAKLQNTIAVLDTGSGKTLVAVLLLRHVLDQELESRSQGCDPKISFFLADKVALVFQQHAVLNANLDQEIGLLCGQMGINLWNKEVWDAQFKKNMVVVCTSDVLHHCLLHGFIRMDQINLLIFDEAHHAKGAHAYARIMKDFYYTANFKPRIFGMTASPVDGGAGEDVVVKARELEVLLDCTIATASDLTIFQRSKGERRAVPSIVRYPRLALPFETQLYQQLWGRYQDMDFAGLFRTAKDLAASLGPRASDNFWASAFTERATKKKEANMMRMSVQNGRARVRPQEDVDKDIARLQEAHAFIATVDFGVPALTASHMSSKVLALFSILHQHFERSTDQKCLVFVGQKATARLLNQIALALGGPHLRSGMLTGTNTGTLDAMKYSHREQAVTMMKFRKGELNCLFATSVGEEGIDIPECNLVIRFDPCKTMIQYVQSRGRARKSNSRFILLHEHGNLDEEDNLQSIIQAELNLQNFCKNAPRDRLLDEDPRILEETVLAPDPEGRVLTMPATKATLTYDLALIVLAHFVSCLPHDDEDDLTITYTTRMERGKFRAEVRLPSRSPIQSVEGRLHARKSTARRSAAFDACILLYKQELLDDNLLPIYRKSLPAMRNALLALTVKHQKAYAMQAKPERWARDRGTLPSSYHLTIVNLRDSWDRPVRPLGIITRHRLPDLPIFPIYRHTGTRADAECIALPLPLTLDDANVSALADFTLAIFKDIFNKTFERAPAKMSYWMAPLTSQSTGASLKDLDALAAIDWRVVTLVASGEPYSWTPDIAPTELIDRFLIDPWDGGRRLFTTGLAPELRPHDTVPSSVAQGNRPGDKYRTTSIIDYSVKMSTKLRKGRMWDPQQPVIEAEQTTHRLNVLASPSEKEMTVITKCFVCPEPLKISLLPSGVAAMALVMPAIIHRIESYLIAIEFADEVGLRMTPALALEAITKDANNTDEHDEDKFNFQRGMGPNYERLEFIGDCFLKMATSLSVFILHSSHNEFAMHVDRMVMLCNKNLLKSAVESKWYRYIRGQAFSRRTWYPRGIALLSGKKIKDNDDDLTQQLADKTIADICEAMIGAALMSNFTTGLDHPSQFDNAVKAVSTFVKNENHTMMKWADYYAAYVVPSFLNGSSSAAIRNLAEQVFQKHDYTFDNSRLLRSAFTHASESRALENLPSYQRLEFLGDSLLDMAAVLYLFERYPTEDPQWLTEHKMAMVSNKFFGAVCVRLGFHKHLRHSNAAVGGQIAAYVEEVEEAERLSDGSRDYWTLVKDPPKCLPDIVESYVGAMFVDSKFNFAEVQRFFDAHVKWFFSDMTIYDMFAGNHPVTKLQKHLSTSMGCEDFRLMSHDLPSEDTTDRSAVAILIIHETVVAHGQSSGSKYAKIKAASRGLELLEGLNPFQFREKYR